MSASDKIIFGDDYTASKLDELADKWKFAKSTETDQTIRVVLRHNQTDAECILVEKLNRLDLRYSVLLRTQANEIIHESFDYPEQATRIAASSMTVFKAGVNHSK